MLRDRSYDVPSAAVPEEWELLKKSTEFRFFNSHPSSRWKCMLPYMFVDELLYSKHFCSLKNFVTALISLRHEHSLLHQMREKTVFLRRNRLVKMLCTGGITLNAALSQPTPRGLQQAPPLSVT